MARSGGFVWAHVFAVLPHEQELNKDEWRHIAFSTDGSRMLTITECMDSSSGDRMDLWDTSTAVAASIAIAATTTATDASSAGPAAHFPGTGSAAVPQPLPVAQLTRSLARVQLGSGRLSALGGGFFPLNANCLCSCGERGVLLIYLEQALDSVIVRQVLVGCTHLIATTVVWGMLMWEACL